MAKASTQSRLPGSIYVSRGRFYWKVKLPGQEKRQSISLCSPGQKRALPEGKGIGLATSIAWRIWEKASRDSQAIATSSAPLNTRTLDEICGLFLAWAETYYRRGDGTQTREAASCENALRPLRAQCGTKLIDEVTYHDILDVRQEIVSQGCCNRNTVNKYVGIWKRFFAWALENRYCSAQTKSEVWAIANLKRNRSEAPEGSGLRPVKHWVVKATMPYLPTALQAMVKVQELTGMRPGEVAIMRPCDVKKKRSGCWIYRPQWHKTQHKGRARNIAIGPRAQVILRPYMTGLKTQYMFRPIDVAQERKEAKRAKRKSKVQPSQVDRSKENPSMSPGGFYETRAYTKAITYALAAAKRSRVVIPHWSPNQLRHACGTRIRRRFGAEASRVVLGHANGAVTAITDRYTREAIEQEELKLAMRVMAAIG